MKKKPPTGTHLSVLALDQVDELVVWPHVLVGDLGDPLWDRGREEADLALRRFRASALRRRDDIEQPAEAVSVACDELELGGLFVG